MASVPDLIPLKFYNGEDINVKTLSCLTLLSNGLLALTAAIALSQPSEAQNSPQFIDPNYAGDVVVPVIPINPAPIPDPGFPVVPPVRVTRDYFFCGRSPNGIPTTYVNTPNGGNTPLIRWVSDYFEPSGYTPEARCRDVSQRFTQFYNQGNFNFITTGFVNQQPVVCVAAFAGGPCTGVLFTLKSGQNANRTVQQLLDARVGAAGPLRESGDRLYVDMRSYTQAAR